MTRDTCAILASEAMSRIKEIGAVAVIAAPLLESKSRGTYGRPLYVPSKLAEISSEEITRFQPQWDHMADCVKNVSSHLSEIRFLNWNSFPGRC